MRRLMDLWQRLTHRAHGDPPEPAPELPRDPDLDVYHREQHSLIERTGYARERIRDSYQERVRRGWRPDGAR